VAGFAKGGVQIVHLAYADLNQALLVPLAVLALWEGLSRAGVLNPLILPSPTGSSS